MNNYYTWKLELEVLKFAGVRPFLVDLAEINHCQLKVLKNESTFWKDKLTVEFKGTEENLTSLREQFIFNMTKYNLPASVKNENYKISSITEEDTANSRRLILNVQASKKSKIKELAEAVGDELWVAHEVSEKSNGFLKGKTVKVTALGDTDKLEKFKAIFESVILDAEMKKKKRVKP